MKYLLFVNLVIINNAFSQWVIPLVEQNNVKLIECTVDGVREKFVFDTGASSTLISKQTFSKINNLSGPYFAFKTEKFVIADGSLVESKTYYADSICVGGLCFKNIAFNVIDSENATSLLGQNVFEKFYSYEVQSNQVKLFPRNYTGENYYEKYSKNTLLETSILTFKGFINLTALKVSKFEYKVADSKFLIDKYDSTATYIFDLYSENIFNDVYSRSKYFNTCDLFTKDLVGKILFDLFTDSEIFQVLKQEITTLKIDEMHFNVCIPFKDQEYCFKRIFYTNQLNAFQEITSQSEIKIF
jgi:hypothetical protein